MVETMLTSLLLLFFGGAAQSQISFGGGGSSGGGSSGGSGSSSAPNNKNTQNTDQRILGIIPGISTGDSNTDSLINGGLLGAGLVAGAGALAGALDPCGRRKRQSEDGTNSKIFGFGSSNCGNNNFGNNNFGNNNFGNNNFGGGSSQCGCQCQAGLTFTSNGVVYGDCRTPDNTGRYWCYTTGFQNNCGDLQSSKRYPNNPWSYNACSRQSQCFSNRDCKGRPRGDKYYGCGCSNGRKRRQTKFFDLRCAEATILGRTAPTQEK